MGGIAVNGVDLPRTGQADALKHFLEANQADLVNYIAQTACPEVVSGAAAVVGLPVPPQVSGILCNFVAQFIGMVIDKCADPGEKNRQFRTRLNAVLKSLATYMPTLPAPPQPAPEELPLLRWARVTAEWQAGLGEVGEAQQASWSQRYQSFFAVAPLVLPGPTTITLRWFVSAGAGGLCEQDMAAVKLLGQGGQTLFERDVEGVYRVGQSETHEDTASAVLDLPAGNYLLLGAVSGESGHAQIAADYTITEVEVTIPEAAPTVGWLLIGAGAWLLATGGRR